jgi:hypothetical protein
MTPDIFREPVRISVGLGFPRGIRSPLDAVIYLNEVPPPARNNGHTMALKTCKAALMGEIEAETARGAFEAYARRQDILAPGADDIVAARSLRRHDPHTF